MTIEQRFTYGNSPADRTSRTPVQRLGSMARARLPAWLLGPMAKGWFAVRGSQQKMVNCRTTSPAQKQPPKHPETTPPPPTLAASSRKI